MSNEDILVGTVLRNWSTTMERLEKTLRPMNETDFDLEVAPGRNRVRYLVGHLAAFHDRLIDLIGLGPRLHPELDVFIDSPDHSFEDAFSNTQLFQFLVEINHFIEAKSRSFSSTDWLLPHNSVSDEAFAADPLRNRLAVLDSRTAHAALHLGQIRLAFKR